MNKQAGFTLIELIMVIVILGILAATALPKFVNLSSDARNAAVQALEGSMRSANSMIYATAAVNNATGPTGTVMVNGILVTTKYGFAQDANAISSVMDIGPQFGITGGNQINYTAAPLNTSCGVTYTVPTSSVGVNSNPTYTAATTGC